MINTLDKVMLTEQAVSRWYAYIASNEVNQKLRGLNSKLIPDEDARINADGTLTIFVLLPDGDEVSLNLSASDWGYRQ